MSGISDVTPKRARAASVDDHATLEQVGPLDFTAWLSPSGSPAIPVLTPTPSPTRTALMQSQRMPSARPLEAAAKSSSSPRRTTTSVSRDARVATVSSQLAQQRRSVISRSQRIADSISALATRKQEMLLFTLQDIYALPWIDARTMQMVPQYVMQNSLLVWAFGSGAMCWTINWTNSHQQRIEAHLWLDPANHFLLRQRLITLVNLLDHDFRTTPDLHSLRMMVDLVVQFDFVVAQQGHHIRYALPLSMQGPLKILPIIAMSPVLSTPLMFSPLVTPKTPAQSSSSASSSGSAQQAALPPLPFRF